MIAVEHFFCISDFEIRDDDDVLSFDKCRQSVSTDKTCHDFYDFKNFFTMTFTSLSL